jgi:TolB protein
MDLQSDPEAVTVRTVQAGSEAEGRGVKAGDRILRIGRRAVRSTWDLMAQIDGAGPEVRLEIGHGDRETLKVSLRRPALAGKLVFRSDRSGPWELWRMNADGSGLRQLTDRALEPQAAVWSPDGTQIAFEWRTPYWDIWVMDQNGGNLRRLTSFPDAETRPRWSADGRYVYFISYQWGGTAIGRINLRALRQEKLVSLADRPGWAPWRYSVYDLSPDGRTLAFPRETPQGWKLHFANRDGSNVRPVAQPGQQVALDWSPDGRRLLWAEGQEHRWWDLESEQVRSFRLPGEAWAAFAPDGESVLYDAAPSDGEKRDLCTADLTGRTLHRLTYHPANDQWGDWWAPR